MHICNLSVFQWFIPEAQIEWNLETRSFQKQVHVATLAYKLFVDAQIIVVINITELMCLQHKHI
jgi:hypothetical protein